MLRSHRINGPYELHPDKHLITSKDTPDAPLQRAGHGQIVETPDGQVYHTFLCSRPLARTRRSPLGRETGIEKCVWKDDDWLYLESGRMVPRINVESPASDTFDGTLPTERIFTGTTLQSEFQWLRTPYPERIFSMTGSALRLTARESIGSWFEQALVARRQEHFKVRVETSICFDPTTYQQAAGLVHYYNRHKFHFLGITWHETLGKVLTILSCPGDWPDSALTFPLGEEVSVNADHATPVHLAMQIDCKELQFFYRVGDGSDWKKIGPILDASVISDEGGRGEHASFTGAFVGMAAFDTSGSAITADFAYFNYQLDT